MINSKSPWLWVPTLYFAEGIPYFLVNNISVMMFTRMGVPNGQMALFTSLLYLPWTIKPFWSPFVDIIKTKRWWVIIMQVLLTIAFTALALSIPHPSLDMIAKAETPISLFTIMLIIFAISAFASATHDIAADGFYMLALNAHSQSAFVGIRSVFYRLSSMFGQGVLLVIAGVLETRTGNIPLAWQLTLLICAVIFAIVSVWHIFFLPKPATDKSLLQGKPQTPKAIITEFGKTFATFFRKPGVGLAIVFMLLYRLPEAFLLKMINPFLVSAPDAGGLALSTETVGMVYGTIGVLLLLLGGILGGLFASKYGLRKSLWLMALALTLPCLSFVFLSIYQPQNIVIICAAIGLDQFGYGFGFSAYMLYMMYFADGESKTSHYAICTAFMALSMMLPGLVAGYIQEALGYTGFFYMVMACCCLTLIVTYFVRQQIDINYGKKNEETHS